MSSVSLDTVVVDQLVLDLEKTFYRFEGGQWFKFNNSTSELEFVENSSWIEEIYLEEINKN